VLRIKTIVLTIPQVRRLPVGDGIWIACHKYLLSEYVLDFIVERKKVDDLRSSIRDNRYRDQKLRLLVRHFPSQCFPYEFNVLMLLFIDIMLSFAHLFPYCSQKVSYSNPI
jgi:hypothetical protein